MDNDAETMKLGRTLAAVLNDYPSDLSFAMLIRFVVQAAQRQTEDDNEAVNLIMRSVLTDMETVVPSQH